MTSGVYPSLDSHMLSSSQERVMDGFMFDKDVATLLSRCAGIKGIAIPVHRFGMLTKNASGLDLDGMSRVDRVIEMWTTGIPLSHAEVVDFKDLIFSEPLVWISSNSQQIYLILGELVGLRYIATDAADRQIELSYEDAVAGTWIRLEQPKQLSKSNTNSEESIKAMDLFVEAIRARKSVFFEAIFATLTMSILALIGSFYSMQVYDRVVPMRGYSTLTVLSIGAILSILLEMCLRQIRSIMVDRACKAMDQELSGVFFGRALAIRMDARPKTVGTFAAQVRQFETVRNFMTSSTLFILTDVPTALIFILVMGLIGGYVSLVAIAFLPTILFVSWLFMRKLREVSGLHIAESNQRNGLLVEAIDGIESIKAANSEWKMLDRWQHLTAVIGERELKMRTLTSMSTNITQSLQQITFILVLIVGVMSIGHAELTTGGLVACSIIVGRALAPLSQAAGFVTQWEMTKSALQGLDQLLTLPIDEAVGERPIIPSHCDGFLKLDAVKFSYTQDVSALEIDALQFKPGERVAILGAAGSGKSTLLKMLSSLYRPMHGRVFLDGVDASMLAPQFVREHIGYLPQDVRLFQGSLRDNLIMGLASPSDAQIIAATQVTGLSQVIEKHPAGLGLEISEGGRGLSGGQRQLVGLTRMLLLKPTILLLDEPTAAMDGDLESQVMRGMIDHIDANSLFVVVTHKLSMLQYVNRLIVLNHGKLAFDGSPEEVISKMRSNAAASVSPLHAVNKGVAA